MLFIGSGVRVCATGTVERHCNKNGSSSESTCLPFSSYRAAIRAISSFPTSSIPHSSIWYYYSFYSLWLNSAAGTAATSMGTALKCNFNLWSHAIILAATKLHTSRAHCICVYCLRMRLQISFCHLCRSIGWLNWREVSEERALWYVRPWSLDRHWRCRRRRHTQTHTIRPLEHETNTLEEVMCICVCVVRPASAPTTVDAFENCSSGATERNGRCMRLM